MDLIAIAALNLVLSAFVIVTIVGGLVWAVLSSRSDQRPVLVARTKPAEPRRPDARIRSSRTQPAGSRDRDPAIAA